MLWGSIELHRQDAHNKCFGLSAQEHVRRTHLDDQLLDPWSYRSVTGVDYDFERRNAKFGTAIRELYRSAGKSQAWTRLAPLVRQICITVTHKSPPHVWDMILSLPNLASVEVIGEYSANNERPPQPASLREPHAHRIRHVRLRGYIPTIFVVEICRASASSVTSLDLGGDGVTGRTRVPALRGSSRCPLVHRWSGFYTEVLDPPSPLQAWSIRRSP
jgi:hypothetical protein